MIVHIFLLCYNEEILLPHTVAYYKSNLPNSVITIYDNESTDNSVKIAKDLGCNVYSFSTGNINDVRIKQYICNNCWKGITDGWIIMADMDEWLCVCEKDLIDEYNCGFTILSIKGVDYIGESQSILLDDINFNEINKVIYNNNEDKSLCFYKKAILEMNYEPGSHTCQPIGDIKYSNNIYVNKHMCNLGLPFIINKMIKRYERCEEMRKIGYSIHYSNDVNVITNNYNQLLNNSYIL
jgi:hypothetical protein